jgi:hypothetical protein
MNFAASLNLPMPVTAAFLKAFSFFFVLFFAFFLMTDALLAG